MASESATGVGRKAMAPFGAALVVCLVFLFIYPGSTGVVVMLAGFSAILTTLALREVLGRSSIGAKRKVVALSLNAIGVAAGVYTLASSLGDILG